MLPIEVLRQYSPLREAAWRFWFDDHRAQLVLDSYQVMERPSLRHKMKVSARYSRLDTRGASLPFDAVPWDMGIEQEAVAQLIGRVTVVKRQ